MTQKRWPSLVPLDRFCGELTQSTAFFQIPIRIRFSPLSFTQNSMYTGGVSIILLFAHSYSGIPLGPEQRSWTGHFYHIIARHWFDQILPREVISGQLTVIAPAAPQPGPASRPQKMVPFSDGSYVYLHRRHHGSSP